MNGRRLAGAVGGALAAGLGLSAMMLAQEKKTGKPAELTDLERASAATLGQAGPSANQLPSTRERGVIHGGHLLLSALAGAAYAAATKEDADTVPSGIVFGLAFYGVAHWLIGPALGVKQPEWKSDASTLAMHATNHVLFGLATAAAAKVATRA